MSDSFTSSKSIALLKGKCPRCRSGRIFKHGAYDLKRFTDMHTDCSVCKLHYEIEPGFFWGAMYVSYTITTGMMLVLGALTYLIGNDPNFWIYILTICGTVIVTSPLVYRYSRIFMLYFFSPLRFDSHFAHSEHHHLKSSK